MKRFFSLAMVACMTVLGLAQRTNMKDYVSVRFTPSHENWVYAVGEEVSVDVTPILHYMPIRKQDMTYTWGPELRTPELEKTISSGANGTVTLKLPGLKEPGFKTLTVTVKVDGRTYSNYINLAFAPDKIQPTTRLPEDFLSFWQGAIAETRKVPLMTDMTPHPELNTDRYTAYEVRFQNHKKGCYLYGLMQIPRNADGTPTDLSGAKKYPVLIEWPGAGVKPHKGIESVATDAGYIVLEMGVNGIPVTENDAVYRDLRANGLNKYQTIGLDNRDTYYYKKIYAGTVKTVDMLCALPFVDSERIVVSGGSQGGALSIVNAALDPRVKAVSAAYPALSEIAGNYHGRVGGWPQILKDANEPARAEKAAVSAYYDVVNFARMIKCPVWMQIGYNDQVCCPTSTYSVYNTLTCPKTLITPLDCAHWQYEEHKKERTAWLCEQIMLVKD